MLTWQRTITANALALSGVQWSAMFAYLNSGTYNNMWLAVDYNLFTPGQVLPSGTLIISEQLPGSLCGSSCCCSL